MDYLKFKSDMTNDYSNFYSEQVDLFFSKAVELARKGCFNEAAQVAKDAIYISRFTNIDYEKIDIIDLLCRIFLDNNQPEYANIYFNFGMKIIHDKNFSGYKKHWDYVNSIGDEFHKYDFMEEINMFLDLKIGIEERLKK